jgi:hypothetical protein
MIFEWFQSFIIIILFILFLCINLFSGSVQNVKNNWTEYRCIPLMMPLAGYIAPDGTTTSDNFSYCIQNIITSFAPTITQPFNYLQKMTVDMMDSINTSNENTIDQTSNIKDSVSVIIGDLYSVFINIIVEFNIIVIKLIDIQGKMAGVMATIMHIMTTVQYTFQSMWDGVPGKMIKTIGKLVTKL